MKTLKWKETKCKEDNIVLLHKNCENCGAGLKLNKENMTCKCDYCNTEYYVKSDILANEFTFVGQIIKINIRGEEKKFYIGEEEIYPIFQNEYRDITGRMYTSKVNCYKEKITLIEI